MYVGFFNSIARAADAMAATEMAAVVMAAAAIGGCSDGGGSDGGGSDGGGSDGGGSDGGGSDGGGGYYNGRTCHSAKPRDLHLFQSKFFRVVHSFFNFILGKLWRLSSKYC
jgi:hypothetical protein